MADAPAPPTPHDSRHHALTLDEKIDLTSGHGLWNTAPVTRLGIRSLRLADGTNGVRYEQDRREEDLGGFLEAVDGGRKATNPLIGRSRPQTCFPSASALGNSWDVTLTYEIGGALASECRATGIDMLLGPGINIRRSPLAGRGFEYFSEDPILTGDLAAAFINGLQDAGVGAVLKHLACNNSEVERTSMNSIVEARALHEVYLLGFERAIVASNPFAVMTAYNRLNGTHCSQNRWLLDETLRQRWGYRGLVMSDWYGTTDLPAALTAGLDLAMPESSARKQRLRRALEHDARMEAMLDRACANILRLVDRCGQSKLDAGFTFNSDAHHALARKAAVRCCVLLRNEGELLPLNREHGRYLIVGSYACQPIIQGAGSAAMTPSRCDRPVDEFAALLGPEASVVFSPGWRDDGTEDSGRADTVLEAAENADTVIVFAGTVSADSGENADRRNIDLLPAHNALISRLASQQHRVVVVIFNPDAVTIPWEGNVGAILMAGFGGQGVGHAIASLLLGYQSPSGKLSVTLPKRLEDTPAFLGYPGENGQNLYREGLFVGYRHYDYRKIEPAFPFGFGLSYTSFAYHGLEGSATSLNPRASVHVRFSLTNTGHVAGREICQIYLRRDASTRSTTPAQPLRALKGFISTDLKPCETRHLSIVLTPRDFSYFDEACGDWRILRGEAWIEVGASSRDIRLESKVFLEGSSMIGRGFDLQTPPGQILNHADGERLLRSWLVETMGKEPHLVDGILSKSRCSFLGIGDTLTWLLGSEPDEASLLAVLDDINHSDRDGASVRQTSVLTDGTSE